MERLILHLFVHLKWQTGQDSAEDFSLAVLSAGEFKTWYKARPGTESAEGEEMAGRRWPGGDGQEEMPRPSPLSTGGRQGQGVAAALPWDPHPSCSQRALAALGQWQGSHFALIHLWCVDCG